MTVKFRYKKYKIGGMTAITDSDIRAAPRATIMYDKYIGFRETRNGPDVTKTVGLPNGLSAVPCDRIMLFAHKPKINPTSMIKNPNDNAYRFQVIVDLDTYPIRSDDTNEVISKIYGVWNFIAVD